MIRWLSLALLLLSVTAGQSRQSEAEKKIAPRFGVDADLDRYPQATAKDALRSVLKAIEAKKFDYLLAHLADPKFVDDRVKDAGGKFEVMVRETARKFERDPEAFRVLRKFLSDGTWPADPGDAVEVKCESVRGQQLFLKKIGNRWFLENRTRADKEPTPPKEKEKEKGKEE